MNKLIKLPIFLGVCGAACAGLLAGVNAITSPIIAKNEADAKAQGYLSMFTNVEAYKDVTASDIVAVDSVDLSDDLYNAGCTGKATCLKAYGCVYDFTVKGFGGDFSFQVGFAEGKYIGYTDISSSESNQGKSLIDGLKAVGSASSIFGKDSTETAIDGKYLNITNNCGSSVTGGAIAKACEQAAYDYNGWYTSVK